MKPASARRLLPCALAALLGACTTPAPRPSAPVVTAPVAAAADAPATPASIEPAAPDDWEKLRRSFAMPGCDADPAILARARFETRHPRQFEQTLGQVLPRLDLVQRLAAGHAVAGEFVLLPWVESHYRPDASVGRNRQLAGMWQFTTSTARSMGLATGPQHDQRLDIQTSTRAALQLLERYYRHFGDWRVSAYAYNVGEYALRGHVRRLGAPGAEPAIPDLPVRAGAREHLTRLLAIACVIREPERFDVTLPTLDAAERIEIVPLSVPTTRRAAAARAGIDEAELRQLNAALGSPLIDPVRTPSLLLTAAQAQRWRSAADILPDAGELAAARTAATPPATATHTVRPGESLWSIARRHAVRVTELKRWNHLTERPLQPGQILLIDSPD